MTRAQQAKIEAALHRAGSSHAPRNSARSRSRKSSSKKSLSRTHSPSGVPVYPRRSYHASQAEPWGVSRQPWGRSVSSRRFAAPRLPSKGRLASINIQRQLHGMPPVAPPKPEAWIPQHLWGGRRMTKATWTKAMRGYRSPTGGFVRSPQGRGLLTDWSQVDAYSGLTPAQIAVAKAQEAGTDAAFNYSVLGTSDRNDRGVSFGPMNRQ